MGTLGKKNSLRLLNRQSEQLATTQNISKLTINEFIITGFDNFEKPVVVGTVILIVYVFVILANFVNIGFIFMDKRLHQPMYLFICNLAIVDMLYCTCSCPTIIGVLLAGYRSISYASCIVQMFGFGLGFVMELFTITVMAFDRLFAIVYPLQYHSIMTNLRSVFITFLLWIVASATMAIMPGTILPLQFCYSTLKYMFCDYGSVIRATCVDPDPHLRLIAIITFVGLFGTFSFICGSYIVMIVVVVKMPSCGNKKKVFNTCFSHLTVVICYYGSAFVMAVLTRTGVVLTLEERHRIKIGMILGPALVNPFIYSFRTKEIRKKILRMVSKV